MTEEDWRACRDPTRMLHHVPYNYSHRKRRLFACACVRRVWELLRHAWSQGAVEIAEQFADDAATKKELIRARERALSAWQRNREDRAARVAVTTAVWDAAEAAEETAAGVRRVVACTWGPAAATKERLWQSAMVRDVFGHPFSSVALESVWLAWNDGAIRKMAQAINDARAFDRLPLLADALEEAGCADAAILAHCRQPGDHVRGCWAVDLLLGKS